MGSVCVGTPVIPSLLLTLLLLLTELFAGLARVVWVAVTDNSFVNVLLPSETILEMMRRNAAVITDDLAVAAAAVVGTSSGFRVKCVHHNTLLALTVVVVFEAKLLFTLACVGLFKGQHSFAQVGVGVDLGLCGVQGFPDARSEVDPNVKPDVCFVDRFVGLRCPECFCVSQLILVVVVLLQSEPEGIESFTNFHRMVPELIGYYCEVFTELELVFEGCLEATFLALLFVPEVKVLVFFLKLLDAQPMTCC